MKISDSNGHKYINSHPTIPKVNPSKEQIRKTKLFEGKPSAKKK